MAATNNNPELPKSMWGGLTSGQRVGFLGCAVLVIAGLVALTLWFSAATYTVLFGGLPPEDAAEIVEHLDRLEVSYRLTDGGSVVQVPASEVFGARMRLAAKSLPQGGEVGFELFDPLSVGDPEFTRSAGYLRALEGELTRTIRAIKQVEGARVHLAPAASAFAAGQAGLATASVVLQMLADAKLSNKQARGISYLVASSVPGLTPANVTIADVNGNVMHRGADVGGAALAANQFEHKNNFEQQTEERILAMIERVFGVGMAAVHVSARFNFDQVEHTAEVFDPNGVVVKSTSTGNGNKAVSYEVSRTVTRTVKSPGQLEQLQIDVMVDGSYREDSQSGEKTFVPRNEEELGKIGALVKKVAELDPQRGDLLEVICIPFKPDDTIAISGEGMGAGFYLVLAKYGIGLVAALFFFSLVFKPFMRLLSGTERVSALSRGEVTTPVSLERLEREMGLAAAVAGAEGGASASFDSGSGSPDGTGKRDALKKELLEKIEEEPEVAASLIRSWVTE